MTTNVNINAESIRAFCERWNVRELSLFGSVLRDDFGPKSDVDVLVVFGAGASPEFDAWEEMREELQSLFGREVDLVERREIVNPFRRHEILTTRQVVYAA